MKMSQAVVVALALILGAAAGYFVKSEPVGEPVAVAREGAQPKKVSDAGRDASIESLRARVKELELLLKEANAERALDRSEAESKIAEVREEAARRPGPGSFRENIERMKKENPEEFERIRRRMQEWRQRRAERSASRVAFLTSIDMTGMRPETKKNHDELIGLIQRQEALESEMHREDLSDEERGRLFAEMRDTGRQLHQKSRAERDALLTATARSLGLQDDDAAEMTATIKEIYEVTDGGFGGGRHGRHGGPGGRGGPRGQ